jgi:hypothetical protein
MRKTSLRIPALEYGEIELRYNPPRQFVREHRANGQNPIQAPALFNTNFLGKEHTKWGCESLGPINGANPIFRPL